MTQRIDQLTEPPRVGRSYNVPCLVPQSFEAETNPLESNPLLSEAEKLWLSGMRPVLLPHHADPELGEPIGHYHIDLRFLSASRLQAFTEFAEGTIKNTLDFHDLLGFVNVHQQGVSDEVFALEWRHLKCHRTIPKTPLDRPLNRRGFEYLQSFIGKPLDCGRCPHRGVSVAAAPRQEGSQVVCPGHGLIIDLKKGQVVGMTHRQFEPKLCVWLLYLWGIRHSVEYLSGSIEYGDYYLQLIVAAEQQVEDQEKRLDACLSRIEQKAARAKWK